MQMVIFKQIFSAEYVMESISKELIPKGVYTGVYAYIYVQGSKFIYFPLGYVPVSMTLEIIKRIFQENKYWSLLGVIAKVSKSQ